MTNDDQYDVDHDARVISFVIDDSQTLQLRVPEVLGAIISAERRDDFIVVTTVAGRVSYHADTPRRVPDLTWRHAHPLAGRIHWHSIRKLLRQHCLLRSLAGRVDFQVTHFSYASGGRSSVGACGRISVDKEPVLQFSASREAPCAWELGAALAEYLFLAPPAAIASNNVLVASVALLDRRLSDEAFEQVDRHRFDHPVWNAFYDLRSSLREVRNDPGGYDKRDPKF